MSREASRQDTFTRRLMRRVRLAFADELAGYGPLDMRRKPKWLLVGADDGNGFIAGIRAYGIEV